MSVRIGLNYNSQTMTNTMVCKQGGKRGQKIRSLNELSNVKTENVKYAG